MTDSASDADRVRNKRLAKLGTSNSSDSRNDQEQSPERAKPQERAPKKINITKAPTDSSDNPFTQLGLDAAQRRPSQTGQRDGAGSPPVARVGTPSSRPGQLGLSESFEAWEDRTLSNVFRVSLEEHAKDSHGNQLFFLRGLRSELESEESPRLNIGLLDQAVIEVASDPAKHSPLEYLLGCWKRITRLNRSHRPSNTDDPKTAVLKDARRICMSYAMFAVTLPDMFGREAEIPSPLAKHLLLEPESDRGICHDFLTEAVSRFSEDESIKDAIVQAMEQLSAQMATKSMTGDYKPYVTVLRAEWSADLVSY